MTDGKTPASIDPGTSGDQNINLNVNPGTKSRADWANIVSVVSTPVADNSRRAALVTSEDEHYQSDNAPFVMQRSQRQKQKRQMKRNLQLSQETPAASQPTNFRGRGKRLIGKSSLLVGAPIAPAKLSRKAIFCIDNVDTSCSVDDMKAFVSSMAVQVISCYDAKPRRRGSVYDRKAFRLCISESDRDRMLDETKWPDSVIISEWYFKPRPTEDKRIRLDEASGGGSGVTVHDDNVGLHDDTVLSGAPTGSHVAVDGNAENNERRSDDSYESPVGDMDTTVVVDYGVNETASSVICEYGGAQ
jgi:hypothetical protein